MDIQPDQHQSKHDRSRTRWTASLDKIFADLVAEQVQQGNRTNHIFDKKTWKYIREEFNRRSGMNFDKKQLGKHLVVLRTRYYNLKSVFEQNTFPWDGSHHMLTAEYGIWEDYIEAHPKPETIKIKDCPIYEQLCTIFSESEADGMYAQSSHFAGSAKAMLGIDTPLLTSGPQTAIVPTDPATPLAFIQGHASSALGVDLNASGGQRKRLLEMPMSPGPRRTSRKIINDAIAEALSEMAAASKLRADVMVQSDDQFSISECIKGLDEIEGIDQQLYFAALDLFVSPDLREMFLSLKRDKRMTWLQGKCNGPSTSMV